MSESETVQSRRGPAPPFRKSRLAVAIAAGPEGTYYGASSGSGTVRIITNKPEPEAVSYGGDLAGGSIAHAREPRFVYAESGRRLAHSPELSAALGLRYDRRSSRTPMSMACSIGHSPANAGICSPGKASSRPR